MIWPRTASFRFTPGRRTLTDGVPVGERGRTAQTGVKNRKQRGGQGKPRAERPCGIPQQLPEIAASDTTGARRYARYATDNVRRRFCLQIAGETRSVKGSARTGS